MKIVSIVGARPQFIKLAPLSKELRKYFEERIVHTGQHFDEEMSQLFFKQLEIPEPEYNLGISGGTHGEQTGKMLLAIEETLIKEKPNLVIVFGDTNSTLAGALCAAKLHIKCVHLEAGLRSFNRTMPEEINRIIADHLSDYLFTPTQTAFINLKNEGLEKRAYLTGDIMVDTLSMYIKKAKETSKILYNLGLEMGKYLLLTLHRPYNVDDPNKLRLLFKKLEDIDEKIVFPAHPRTVKVIKNNNLCFPDNLVVIKPLGYLDFIILELNSKKILTDSGGIQKEAYILKKPCITLRPETEWLETVEDGWNMLVKIDDNDFVEKVIKFNPTGIQRNVFGKDVTKKIVNEILNIFDK